MKIGELAQVTGTPIETIRYYEREELLAHTTRTQGNYRIYEDAHVERLSFIRHCRSLDMTLDEIRVLLRFKDAPAASCTEVNAMLDEHIGHVVTRIRDLKQLEKQLKILRDLCQETREASHCGILTELTRSARRSPKIVATPSGHVHGVHKGGSQMVAQTSRRKAAR
jgi:Cd(II)/Pb(II)-responsive transcriptional regulator